MVTRYGVIRNGRLVREMSADEVESAGTDYLCVTSPQTARALAVLQEAFPQAAFVVMPGGDIHGSADIPAAEVSRVLVHAGVDLVGLAVHRRDIEEVFLDLMGDGDGPDPAAKGSASKATPASTRSALRPVAARPPRSIPPPCVPRRGMVAALSMFRSNLYRLVRTVATWGSLAAFVATIVLLAAIFYAMSDNALGDLMMEYSGRRPRHLLRRLWRDVRLGQPAGNLCGRRLLGLLCARLREGVHQEPHADSRRSGVLRGGGPAHDPGDMRRVPDGRHVGHRVGVQPVSLQGSGGAAPAARFAGVVCPDAAGDAGLCRHHAVCGVAHPKQRLRHGGGHPAAERRARKRPADGAGQPLSLVPAFARLSGRLSQRALRYAVERSGARHAALPYDRDA